MSADVEPRVSRSHLAVRDLLKAPLMTHRWQTDEVGGAIRQATSPERAERQQANSARYGGPDFAASRVVGLNRVVRCVDEAGHWLSSRVGPSEYNPGDVPARCAMLVLRRSLTTASAISLLLSHGYVTDGFARWRALHELTSTAVLLARHREALLAERYLSQAGMLPRGYQPPPGGEVDVTGRDYKWLRPLFPTQEGRRPQRLTQSSVFRAADLALEDYPEYISAANDAVHLSSATLSSMRWEDGPYPLGYSVQVVDDVAHLCSIELYEATAGCLLLVSKSPEALTEDEIRTAAMWLDALFDVANGRD